MYENITLDYKTEKNPMKACAIVNQKPNTIVNKKLTSQIQIPLDKSAFALPGFINF